MSLVRDFTPQNLAQEKEKFFDDFSYNPHFEYKKLVIRNKLTKYGLPKPELLKLAQEILDQAFHNRSEQDIRELEGPLVDLKQAKELAQDFIKNNQLTEEISVNWSKDFLSKASFYKNQLKIRLPINYHQQEFVGTLYHELGTHALRRINYSQQAFFKKKKKFGFKEYLFTEEGLAYFHTLIPKNFKLAYGAALNYLLTDIAQKSSFAETFAYTTKYIKDKERAWKFTVKHKRGLYDTSKAGGFTKDLVYFAGMVEVWQYLKQSNFDLAPLYLGKIAWQDIDKAIDLNPNYQPILPNFYTDNKKRYQQLVTKIAKINLIA